MTRRFPSLLSDFFTEPVFNADWGGEKNLFAQVPPVNIEEKDKEFYLEIGVPGMKKDDFHISCEDGLLTVKAEKEIKKEEKEKNFTRREYNYNSFTRSFTIPQSINTDQVKAKYEDGVLKLTLPKKEEAKAKAKAEIKIS